MVLLQGLGVVRHCIFRLAHIIEGVAHADQRLDLIRAVLQGLLVVLDRVLEVTSLEKKITHGNEAEYVLRIQVYALF